MSTKVVVVLILTPIFTVIFTLLLFFLMGLFVRTIFTLYRRKGISLKASFLFASVVLLLSSLAGYLLVMKLYIDYEWKILLIIFFSTLFCYYITPEIYIYFNLKKRQSVKTYPGPRKPPKISFMFWGNLFLLLGVWAVFLQSSVFVVNSDLREFMLTMTFPFIGGGLICRKYHEFYISQPKEREIIINPEFVLYLRSFELEYGFFYFGKYMKQFGNTIQGFAVKLYGLGYGPINFDIFFSNQLKEYIGEFTGLGDPNEIFAREGGKMIYVGEHWQSKLKSLLLDCRCIILNPALTESIKYELSEILKSRLYEKLFFFIKPVNKGIINRLLIYFTNFMTVRHNVPWNDFQALLNEAGFHSNINPSGGEVVGFDAHANAIILKENCKLPSDYVIAVRDDLLLKKLL